MGAFHTVDEHLVKIELLPPAARTTTANGTGVNVGTISLNQSVEELMVVLNAGTFTGTSPTADVKLQDSADGSSWADITGAVFTQITTSNDDKSYFARLKQKASRPHLRAVITIGGTTPVCPTACYAYGRISGHKPVVNHSAFNTSRSFDVQA